MDQYSFPFGIPFHCTQCVGYYELRSIIFVIIGFFVLHDLLYKRGGKMIQERSSPSYGIQLYHSLRRVGAHVIAINRPSLLWLVRDLYRVYVYYSWEGIDYPGYRLWIRLNEPNYYHFNVLNAEIYAASMNIVLFNVTKMN